MKSPNILIISLVFLPLFLAQGIQAQEDTTGIEEIPVIKNWMAFEDAPNALYIHIADQAYEQLQKREELIANLDSLSDWKQRQISVKETLSDIVGPFPEKTPLRAKVVGKIKKDDYSVEHIIYESRPGFYVTSSIFIPEGLKKREKTPAIIYTSGHTVEGYRGTYQQIILNLVKKGFIVFAFDPVGQGERLEYFDQPKPKSYSNTYSHSYSGAQAYITGSSQASYMIWDGIRAVDYLLTRKEVDPDRIGITGRSGGGTQSSQIAALDERIYAVAPENYITNYTRLLQSIGPQDGEQNLFNGIARGIDHADLLAVRAPKPALILATTGDFFSVQGFMETAEEVSKIYKAYGKEDNFKATVDVFPEHKSTKNNREATYAFFQKHLKNPGSPVDQEVEFLTKEEMRVTPTGQVFNSLEGETVFSLNGRAAEKLVDTLNLSRKNLSKHLLEVLNSAKSLSGYNESTEIQRPVLTGTIVRKGYSIDTYFVKGEGDYVIPYLLMRPEVPNGKSLIYLHPRGKSVEAGEGDELEWFAKNGFTVLAPDLVGIGEVGSVNFSVDSAFEGANYNVWFGSVLTGRSIVGIQASDVTRLTKVLETIDSKTKIYGMAKEAMCATLLHAAAFNTSIQNIALVHPYSSYATIATTRMYDPKFVNSFVPGALTAYDLPDLMAVLAPRKLLITAVTDGSGKLGPNNEITEDLALVKEAYQVKNSENQLHIKFGDPNEKLKEAKQNGKYEELYSEWLR